MKEIKVRFKNGLVKVFKIKIPKVLKNIEECDYIDNWLTEHGKGAMGWFTD